MQKSRRRPVAAQLCRGRPARGRAARLGAGYGYQPGRLGLFGSDVGIKLPQDDQQRLLAEPGAGPFGPHERPMAGYTTIPADWPADTAGDWIGRSLAYVAGLPPKQPKTPAKPRR